MDTTTDKAAVEARPWFREPMVWLIIAIPLFAFVAGLAMLGYAIAHPDADVRKEERAAPTVTGARIHPTDASRFA
jgi:hypothetical protein